MIEIYTRTLASENVSFKGTIDERIIDLKRKIKKEMDLDDEGLCLLYNGVFLDDNQRTLGDYDFRKKNFINIMFPLNGGTKIFAKTEDGKTISFEVLKNEKIIDVKRKIKEKIALEIDELKLVLNGQTLDNEKTVDEYKIVDDTVINVIKRNKNAFQIFAKTMDGKTVAIEVENNHKISDVKNIIQTKLGLAPDEQKIIFNGVIVEDDKTVENYNIVAKSVINIVARLRGGLDNWSRTVTWC